MKNPDTVQKQKRPPQEEGEYIEIYDGGGTIMIKDDTKEGEDGHGSVRIDNTEAVNKSQPQ